MAEFRIVADDFPGGGMPGLVRADLAASFSGGALASRQRLGGDKICLDIDAVDGLIDQRPDGVEALFEIQTGALELLDLLRLTLALLLLLRPPLLLALLLPKVARLYCGLAPLLPVLLLLPLPLAAAC